MEPFLVKKALDFSLPAIGKSVSVVFKGLLVLGLIIGAGWSIYVTMIKPHTNPTPTQKAETIENYYYYPNKKVFGLGVNLWGLDLGIMKYDYPKEPKVNDKN